MSEAAPTPGGAPTPTPAPANDPAPTPAPANDPAPTPAPANDPAPTPQPAPTSWTDTLTPDHKEYVSSKGFKDPSAVLDSYINLEKLRGVPQERLLKLPEPEAPAEEWNPVFEKLGRPANPDGYGLEPSEGGDEGFLDWAKSTFHQLNLTKTQAQSLIQKFGEFTNERIEAQNTEYVEKTKAQEMSLKKEWGAAYDQNIRNAQAASRAFGIPGDAVDALEKVMGFDGVMKFMHDIGSKIGESGFHGGNPRNDFGPDGGVLTPQQAKAKIDALKKDPGFVENYTKGDVQAKERLSRLHKMAYPDD